MTAVLIHADRQRDIPKLISAFCDYANARNKETSVLVIWKAGSTGVISTIHTQVAKTCKTCTSPLIVHSVCVWHRVHFTAMPFHTSPASLCVYEKGESSSSSNQKSGQHRYKTQGAFPISLLQKSLQSSGCR